MSAAVAVRRTCPIHPHDPCAAWRVLLCCSPWPPGRRWRSNRSRSLRPERASRTRLLSKRARIFARGVRKRTSRWVACCRASRSTDSTPGTSTAARSISEPSVVPTGRSFCFPRTSGTAPQRQPCRWWTWPTSSGVERQGRRPKQPRVQQVASAELQVALAARALLSGSGVDPDLLSSVELDFDPRPEPPLSDFEKRLAGVPAVLAAARTTRAAEQLALAQRLTLAPSIAGYFAETGSNAPGFVGRDWSYLAGITLRWSLDLTTFANIRRQDANLDAERARELRTWLSSGDAIHQQWNTVAAGIAKSRAARAGRQAAFQAAAQARSRYAVGNIAQLDLLQAQRDAFIADVNRIQADADLANARAQLRLASGRSLVESTNERNALP